MKRSVSFAASGNIYWGIGGEAGFMIFLNWAAIL